MENDLERAVAILTEAGYTPDEGAFYGEKIKMNGNGQKPYVSPLKSKRRVVLTVILLFLLLIGLLFGLTEGGICGFDFLPVDEPAFKP
jgi:hypothetical protein